MSTRSKKQQPISYEELGSDIEVEDDFKELNVDEVLTDDLLASSDEEKKKKKKQPVKKTLTKRKAPAAVTKRATTAATAKKKAAPAKTQTKLNVTKVEVIKKKSTSRNFTPF
jgi:topoisomerase IA-like protein